MYYVSYNDRTVSLVSGPFKHLASDDHYNDWPLRNDVIQFELVLIVVKIAH